VPYLPEEQWIDEIKCRTELFILLIPTLAFFVQKFTIQLPDTRFGRVNEYRHTTAPVDSRLHGAQGGGVTFFCGPSVGVASKKEVDAVASSRNFNVNWATPKH
jgi:hypothetical protein